MSATNQKQIIHALTEEIIEAQTALSSEGHMPAYDPDISDDKIKAYKDRLSHLRTIRQTLEIEFANPLI